MNHQSTHHACEAVRRSVKRLAATFLCAVLIGWSGWAGPVTLAGQTTRSNSAGSAQAQAPPADQDPNPNRRAMRIARKLAAKPGSKDPAQAHPDRKADHAAGGPGEASKPLGSASDLSGQANGSERGLGTGSGWVLNTLTALGVVIGLVFLCKWGYQKVSGARAVKPSSAVEVLCRTSVAPKNHVLLLRVGQRVLIVSDSSQGLRTLSEIEEPEEVASLLQAVTAERDSSLSDNFNRLLSRYHPGPGQDPGQDQQSTAEHGGQTDRTQAQVSGLLGRVRSLGSVEKGGIS